MSLLKIYFIGIVLMVASCKSNEISVVNSVNATAIEVFTEDEVEIPYYDFEEFEKFLHIEDDEIYVINFWATWCQPCVEELPHFESINTTYKHKGVNVVLVSFDKPAEVENKLLPYINKHDIRSEVVILSDANIKSWKDRVDPHWAGSIPITIIYSKEKRRFYERNFSLCELKNEVEKFLKK